MRDIIQYTMRNYIDWTDPLIVGLPLCQICAFEKIFVI